MSPPALPRRLLRDRRALALTEFALALPLFLTLCLTGAELGNYIITRMRVSQLALHVADNAARMGTGTQIQAKTVSENDVNDLFAGVQLQSAGLDVKANGRIILSDLEQDGTGSTTYQIKWQRCWGSKATHASGFGVQGQKNLAGIGPVGRLVPAQDGSATMFVEVYYVYTPLLNLNLIPTPPMTETASMAVRDRRDLSQVYNASNAPVMTC